MIDAVLFDLGDTIINFGVGRREVEALFRIGARLTYDYLAAHHPDLPPYEVYLKVNYRLMSRPTSGRNSPPVIFPTPTFLYRASRKLHLTLNDGRPRAPLPPCGTSPSTKPPTSTRACGKCSANCGRRERSSPLFPTRSCPRTASTPTLKKKDCSSSSRCGSIPQTFAIASPTRGSLRWRFRKSAWRRTGHSSSAISSWPISPAPSVPACEPSGKPSLKTAPPLFHPSFSILRGSRKHRPDFTIRRITDLPNVLRHFGWKPTHPSKAPTV